MSEDRQTVSGIGKSGNRLTMIVPVYNREKIVADTLMSISAQTSHDFRLILVDNNSTDGTLGVLSAWAASQDFPVEILRQPVKGAAAARQMGLDACETEWTMFFDSDDYMQPDHVARILERIASHPDADVFGWDVEFRFPDRTFIKSFYASDLMYHCLFHGNMATQRYCARTDLFRRAGGWNTGLSIWDDIEFGARICALSPRVRKIEGSPRVSIRLSPDSISLAEKSGSLDLPKIRLALDAIKDTIGENRSHWTALKLMILAALEPDGSGRTLRDEILHGTSRRYRGLLRLAYAYTNRGHRGIARLLRPLM